MRKAGLGLSVLALALWACKATTSRPTFVPFPEAGHGEIGFGLADPVATITRATTVLAEALRADSIPIDKVRIRDGYLETPWFDTTSLAATGARPLGPDVVKVRGWVNPAKPGFSELEVETVYVPFADPSRTERDLEAPVPPGHPVAKRVEAVIKALIKQYGEPDTTTVRAAPPGARPPIADTGKGTAPDTSRADTARKARPDPTGPDTTGPARAHPASPFLRFASFPVPSRLPPSP